MWFQIMTSLLSDFDISVIGCFKTVSSSSWFINSHLSYLLPKLISEKIILYYSDSVDGIFISLLFVAESSATSFDTKVISYLVSMQLETKASKHLVIINSLCSKIMKYTNDKAKLLYQIHMELQGK